MDSQSDTIFDVNHDIIQLSGFTHDELAKLTASYLFRPEGFGGASWLR